VVAHPSRWQRRDLGRRIVLCKQQTLIASRQRCRPMTFTMRLSLRTLAFRDDRHKSLLFERMAGKSGIEHRYSFLRRFNVLETQP
jgi:hypothetical protein